MNWQGLLAFVAARLKERSTWLGLFALLSAAGVMIAPELRDAIIAVAIILAGGTAAITPDPPPAPPAGGATRDQEA
ncbi:MAG TPA: hypothetical protein VJ890_14565 [Vineibacter sp.]|nr:hypothetical protein [Vineibacter sp.]